MLGTSKRKHRAGNPQVLRELPLKIPQSFRALFRSKMDSTVGGKEKEIIFLRNTYFFSAYLLNFKIVLIGIELTNYLLNSLNG